MSYEFRCLLVTLAALGATACAAAPEPPATPPATLIAPPALTEDGYAELVVTERFPGTPAEVRAFLDTDQRLLLAMPDTAKIVRPVGGRLVRGTRWPEAGAERVLEFSDGHYAFERVTEFSPERFAYQVWGFTGPTAANVAHIHGIQELAPGPDGGTQFTWIYKVKPAAGWKRPFVQRFVDTDVRELLETATRSVAGQARREAAQ